MAPAFPTVLPRSPLAHCTRMPPITCRLYAGYLGLYAESISDSTSTAEAEFGNFSAAQL